MKKHYILLLTLPFFVFISCKKENQTKIESTPTGNSAATVDKIKTIKSYFVDIGDTSLTEYYYDSAGRLSKTKSNGGTTGSVIWTGNQVIYTVLSSSNTVIEKLTYPLNLSGRAGTASGIFDSSSIEKVFNYNSDNYIVNSTEVIGDDTITSAYTITDGNAAISTTKYSNSFIDNNTTVTQFYTDKANTIGRLNTGFNITGKQNKNLEQIVTTTYPGYTTVDTYIYEFDSKNRVVEKIVNSLTYSSSEITLYTYY